MVGLPLLAAGCSYSGEWLFPEPDPRVPGVQDLGTLEPATVSSYEEIQEAVQYGELAPTGTADIGGATFTFEGTGGAVCIWVDPETVFWSQSVAASNPQRRFAYPDNVRDDGDIDIRAGLSVYYNGSPGVTLGDFQVRYQDELGNSIPVEFNQCVITSEQYPAGGAHSGRAAPEYCTLNNTQLGTSYTVILELFSAPYDDNRLGYGLLLTHGNCENLRNLNPTETDECLILGESIRGDNDHDYRDEPFIAHGFTEVEDVAWEGSSTIEGLFCAAYSSAQEGLYEYCLSEEEEIPIRSDCDEPDIRCFCGDIADTPSPGSR